MQNSFKKLPVGLRATLKVSVPLAIVIVLFVLVGNFGLPKIANLRNQISDAQNLKASLTQKLGVLQTFSGSPASSEITAASAALPNSDPSPVIVSQLQNATSCCAVVISEVKSGSAAVGSSALLTVGTTFQVVGTRDGVINFLKYIQTLAPISIVTGVKLSETSGVDTASVSMISYWAPFPKVIPSVNQPITSLSTVEEQILSQVATLVQPTVTQGFASEPGVNLTPFGQ